MIMISVRGLMRCSWICSTSASGRISTSASRRFTSSLRCLRRALRVAEESATFCSTGRARARPVFPRTVRPVLTARSTSVSRANVTRSSARSMRLATSPAAMLPPLLPTSHTLLSRSRTRLLACRPRWLRSCSCIVRIARQAASRSASLRSAIWSKVVPMICS